MNIPPKLPIRLFGLLWFYFEVKSHLLILIDQSSVNVPKSTKKNNILSFLHPNVVNTGLMNKHMLDISLLFSSLYLPQLPSWEAVDNGNNVLIGAIQ